MGEHYTIEFENLVESDEGGESPQPCPRPISDDEIKHLQDHHYAAISEKQEQIDQKLQQELEAQEEQLRQEEEARHEAQRQAARWARERKAKELQVASQRSRGQADGSGPENTDQRPKQSCGEDLEVYLQTVKAQSETFRNNRLPSDPTVVTPNTELSWDFTAKTKSTNEDGSLDLEWEDEEGINRSLPPWERSRTEEDILRAALRPGSKAVSDESAALEWEEDFISSQDCADLDSELQGFVNPVLDTPSDLEELESHR